MRLFVGFCVAFQIVLFCLGFSFGLLYRSYVDTQMPKACDIKAVHMKSCFNSCATLLLLTPDDKSVYDELYNHVYKCASE